MASTRTRSKSPARRSASPARGRSPSRTKRVRGDKERDAGGAATATLTLTLRFEDIDEEHEKAVLTNYGDEDIDLQGFHLKDLIGGNSSANFEGPHVVPAHQSVNIWTAPGGQNNPGDSETATDFFWFNRSGGPRKHSVLNDEGDGLELVGPKGEIVLSQAVSVFRTKRNAAKNSLQLRFTEIDEANEKATLANLGSRDVDLQGFYLRDIVGGNRSAEFKGPHVVKAGSSVTIWTAPGQAGSGIKEETATDFFWMNKSGGPRKHPVLNDAGDGLELVDQDDNVVACDLIISFRGSATSSALPSASFQTLPNINISSSSTPATSKSVNTTIVKSTALTTIRPAYTALSVARKYNFKEGEDPTSIFFRHMQKLKEIEEEVFLKYDP